MNKKFLSAILFGALMVTSTGTFVSCKDYDDDIDNLQEQINKLATKDDMAAQIATLQAALTNAASEASAALAKATAAEAAAQAAGDTAAAAQAAADKAAAEAKAEAIKAAQAEVAATKAALEEAVAAGLAESKAEMDKLSAEIKEATKKVEEIVGEIADMVTSVELVESHVNGQGFGLSGDFTAWPARIVLSTAIEKEKVFSKDIANAITFVKGAQVQTPGSFLIRVSPANAVLTPAMISLVNSQGQNLDEMLEVTKVEKSNELLTSRAATNSGLWKVSVQLKNYNSDTFAAATQTKVNNQTKNILFAAQVNNTLSTSDVRYVTSSYDLTLAWKEYKPAKDLNFFVNNEHVANINNRYSTDSKSLKDKTVTVYKEMIWDTSKTNIPTTSPITSGDNVNITYGDDRDDKELYPAVQGEAFTISLTTSANAADDYAAPTNIRAMYVVLDKANALESAPSEWNAWDSYNYEGLNTVVEGTSAKIKISGASTIDDIIGFRVYAVNYDGTLVDPDGKAFYVKLGKAAADWNAIDTKVLAGYKTPAQKTYKSNEVAVSLTNLKGATTATWKTDKCGDTEESTNAFTAYFVDANGTVLYSTDNLTGFPTNDANGNNFARVAKVYTVPTCDSWLHYKDNKAYKGTLTISNADKFVLATIEVSMTKELPTTMPEGYSLKDKQVIGGIYNCYMIADVWTAQQATKGTMPLVNLINFGKDESNGTNYLVGFAASADDSNNDGALETVWRAGNGTLDVATKYIDNKTEHATAIYYNFGKISTETKDGNGAIANYMVAGDSFKTVYCCFYKPTVHTWDWATRAQLGGNYNKKDDNGNWKANPLSTTLTYGNPVDGNGAPKATAAYSTMIFGKNAIDGTFSKLLSAVYEGSLEVVEATLISDATQKEDYFSVSKSIEFTPIKTDLGSNPKENVPSTLIIKCKDSYKHDVVITLKMTVAPRK